MDDRNTKKPNTEGGFSDSPNQPDLRRARRVSTLHKKQDIEGMTHKKTADADYDPDFDEPRDKDFADMAGDYTDENGLDPDFDYYNGTSETTQERRKVRELNSANDALDEGTIKAEKEQKKKSRIKKIIFWTVLECITLAVILIYGYFLRSWNLISRPEINEEKIENNNISLEKKMEMEQGWWTIAVFGVDGRSASDLVSKGLNSDVIIIVNVNLDNGDIRMCSVFRDTYLNISDNDTYRKINAAYCNGGPEQALAALNKNLDLNIKNYVTFNWKAVADGINILGGIDDIDISKAEFYYINAFITETVQVTKIGSHHLKSPGTQHLDGVQAVAYGRLRLMDSDYARVERQKKVIKACFDKAKKANFSVLNNIMVVCFPEVATNINFNDVVVLAQNITKYNITETGGFPWMRSETANSKIGDVIVPATLESNVIKLHDFLFDDENYQPSNACLRYSETIKEKTGIYKEGQVIESVRTDGGLISSPKPKETESSKAEEDGTTKETETDEDGRIIEKPSIGVDSNGNYVYPTNADGEIEIPKDRFGNILYPTDEYGNIIYETDAEGNVVNPTNPDGSPYTLEETRPHETEEGEGGPGSEDGPGGESSHADDHRPDESVTKENGSQAGPSPVKPTTTENNGPGSGGNVPATKENDKPSGTVDPSNSGGPGSTDGPGGSGSGSNPPGTTQSGGNTPGDTDGPGGSGSGSGSNAPGSSGSGSGSGSNAPGDSGSGSSSGGNAPGSSGSESGSGSNAPGGSGSSSSSGGNAPGGSGSGSGSTDGPGGSSSGGPG